MIVCEKTPVLAASISIFLKISNRQTSPRFFQRLCTGNPLSHLQVILATAWTTSVSTADVRDPAGELWFMVDMTMI